MSLYNIEPYLNLKTRIECILYKKTIWACCHSVFIYPTTFPKVRCNTRSIFFSGLKFRKAGLNSNFSFSKTGCQTKAKEFSLLYCLLLVFGEEMDLYIFQGHFTQII